VWKDVWPHVRAKCAVFNVCGPEKNATCMLATVRCVVLDDVHRLSVAQLTKVLAVLARCAPNLHSVLLLQNSTRGSSLHDELAVGLSGCAISVQYALPTTAVQDLRCAVDKGDVSLTPSAPTLSMADAARCAMSVCNQETLGATLVTTCGVCQLRAMEPYVAAAQFMQYAQRAGFDPAGFVDPEGRFRSDLLRRGFWLGKLVLPRRTDVTLGLDEKTRYVVCGLRRGRLLHVDDATLHTLGAKFSRAIEAQTPRALDEFVQRTCKRHFDAQALDAFAIERFVGRGKHAAEINMYMNDPRTCEACFVHNALARREALFGWGPADFVDDDPSSPKPCSEQLQQLLAMEAADLLHDKLAAFPGEARRAFIAHVVHVVLSGLLADAVLRDEDGPCKRALCMALEDRGVQARTDHVVLFWPEDDGSTVACDREGRPWNTAELGTKRREAPGDACDEQDRVTFLRLCAVSAESRVLYVPCTRSGVRLLQNAMVVDTQRARNLTADNLVLCLPRAIEKGDLCAVLASGSRRLVLIAPPNVCELSSLAPQVPRWPMLATKLKRALKDFETRDQHAEESLGEQAPAHEQYNDACSQKAEFSDKDLAFRMRLWKTLVL
jgi:hypothetical protein